MIRRRTVLGAAGASLLAAPALAQPYPSKPLKMIVPYPPGGNADVVARMRAFYDAWWAKLEPGFSQPIPVLLGTNAQKTVLLTSVDWWEVDCDNIDFVSRGDGGPRGGDAQPAGRLSHVLPAPVVSGHRSSSPGRAGAGRAGRAVGRVGRSRRAGPAG